MSLDAARLPDEWAQHPGRNCRDLDPDVFFPVDGNQMEEIKAICDGCPVRPQCLDHALRFERDGVWGGTSERQRVRMRRAAGITVRNFHNLHNADAMTNPPPIDRRAG